MSNNNDNTDKLILLRLGISYDLSKIQRDAENNILIDIKTIRKKINKRLKEFQNETKSD